jgi:hypothetical protein
LEAKSEQSGATGRRVLGLREVYGRRQLQAGHPLRVKATMPRIYTKILRQQEGWLGQRKKYETGFGAVCIAESISHTAIRSCIKYGDNYMQTVGCTWMQTKSLTENHEV